MFCNGGCGVDRSNQSLEALPSLVTTYTRDGGDVLRDLVHQFGQGNIELGDLFRKKIDLLDQAVHLDAHGIDRPALRRRTSPPHRGRARG